MTCEQAAQIHAYYDNDLPPEQRATVESHLAVCAECTSLLNDLKNLSQMLATVPLPDMPPRAIHRMYGSWWASKQNQERSIRRLAGALTAVAAAIMVFVPMMSSSSRPPETDVAWEDTIAFIPPAAVSDGANARDGVSYDLERVVRWIASDVADAPVP